MGQKSLVEARFHQLTTVDKGYKKGRDSCPDLSTSDLLLLLVYHKEYSLRFADPLWWHS